MAISHIQKHHLQLSNLKSKRQITREAWVTECGAVMLFWGPEDPANNVDNHKGFARSKFSNTGKGLHSNAQ